MRWNFIVAAILVLISILPDLAGVPAAAAVFTRFAAFFFLLGCFGLAKVPERSATAYRGIPGPGSAPER